MAVPQFPQFLGWPPNCLLSSHTDTGEEANVIIQYLPDRIHRSDHWTGGRRLSGGRSSDMDWRRSYRPDRNRDFDRDQPNQDQRSADMRQMFRVISSENRPVHLSTSHFGVA